MPVLPDPTEYRVDHCACYTCGGKGYFTFIEAIEVDGVKYAKPDLLACINCRGFGFKPCTCKPEEGKDATLHNTGKARHRVESGEGVRSG